MIASKNFTCCFTGHRVLPTKDKKNITEMVDAAIMALISEGYFVFVAGGALGFDTLAAQRVMALKEIYEHIRLVLVTPCQTQPIGWTDSQKRRYERILNAADQHICLESDYSKDSMKNRNQYMVNISSACICYCTNQRSGAGQTVRMAEQKGIRVIDIAKSVEMI